MSDNGWISVEDRLPEEYAAVIVGRANEGHVFEANYCSDKGFYVVGRLKPGLLLVPNITHWQPLPPPPREVGS